MYLVHTVKIEKTLQLFKSAQFLNVDELTLMSENWTLENSRPFAAKKNILQQRIWLWRFVGVNSIPHFLSMVLRQDRTNQSFHPWMIGTATRDVARSRKSKFVAQHWILVDLFPIFFWRKRRVFCRRIWTTFDDITVVVVKTPSVVSVVKSTIDFLFRWTMSCRVRVVARSTAFRRNVFDDQSFGRFSDDVIAGRFGDVIGWIGRKGGDVIGWIARKRHE